MVIFSSCSRADCGGDSPPSLHSEWCSCTLPAQSQHQLRMMWCFYLFSGGKCCGPSIYLLPVSIQPQLPCLNVTLTAPFSLDLVFVFLTRHLTTSSKEASLFNLNTLRQSEGNRPHRPSAAWQVSMSQGKRWRLKCPPSCCHDNNLAGRWGMWERAGLALNITLFTTDLSGLGYLTIICTKEI